MIEEIYPLIPGKLDDGTRMHCETRLFFEESNIISHFNMAEEELSGLLFRIQFVQSNMSNDFLNFDQCILSTNDKTYGDSAAPVVEITVDNDYIHILHDLSK